MKPVCPLCPVSALKGQVGAEMVQASKAVPFVCDAEDCRFSSRAPPAEPAAVPFCRPCGVTERGLFPVLTAFSATGGLIQLLHSNTLVLHSLQATSKTSLTLSPHSFPGGCCGLVQPELEMRKPSVRWRQPQATTGTGQGCPSPVSAWASADLLQKLAPLAEMIVPVYI